MVVTSKDPRDRWPAVRGHGRRDRSVDVDERRPGPAAADPHRPAESVAGLAPPQQAYGKYVRHSLGCDRCRDVDAGPCSVAKTLWAVYQEVGAATVAKFAGASDEPGTGS